MLGNRTDLVEFNGQVICRELNPALRIGDEVFLSSPKRLSAKDTNFVVLGFSPFDLKHLEQTWHVVLVDPTASHHTEENFKVFKAAPLNFFGIIPENKGVEARVPVLQEIEPLFYILLEKLIFVKINQPFGDIGFCKAPPSSHNTQINRPKRSNAVKKHCYHQKRARLLYLPTNLPPEKSYQKHQKVQTIAVVSKNSQLQTI